MPQTIEAAQLLPPCLSCFWALLLLQHCPHFLYVFVFIVCFLFYYVGIESDVGRYSISIWVYFFLFIILFYFILFFNMSGYFVCMHVCTKYMFGAPGSQKKVSDPLKLEPLMRSLVGASSWTQVPWKRTCWKAKKVWPEEFEDLTERMS